GGGADALAGGAGQARLGAAQGARAVRRRSSDRERAASRLPAPHLPVNAGDKLGPYRIESVLGRGGMGTVYLATHARLERRVALKLIAPDLADDPDFRARFLRESRLGASLDPPPAVPVSDARAGAGGPLLAMWGAGGPGCQ